MRKGFTLLEVLFSFTLTSLVLILVLNLFPTSMASVHVGEQRQHAGELANSLVERWVALPFYKLTVGTNETAEQREGAITYTTHLEIAAVKDRNPDFLRAIRVTVSWQYQGRSQHVNRELLVHRLASERL